MSLLFCDSFAHYAQGDLNKKWDVANSWTTTYFDIDTATPRRSGGSYLVVKEQTSSLRKNISGTGRTFIVGFGIRFSDIDSARFLTFYHPEGYQVTLYLCETGHLRIERSIDSTILSTTTEYPIAANIWTYIELKIYVDQSAGTIAFQRNGAPCTSTLHNADTQNSTTYNYISGIGFLGTGSFEYWISDLYIANTEGSTCNDFLGDIRIDVVVPTSDGTYEEWTSTEDPDGYAAVDDAGNIDDDTTYISAGETGDRETFNFGNMPSLQNGTIHAVVPNITSRKENASQLRLKALARVSASDYESDDEIGTPNEYKTLQFPYEQDPDTSTNWTESGVNAAEFGVMTSSSSSSSSSSAAA